MGAQWSDAKLGPFMRWANRKPRDREDPNFQKYALMLQEFELQPLDWVVKEGLSVLPLSVVGKDRPTDMEVVTSGEEDHKHNDAEQEKNSKERNHMAGPFQTQPLPGGTAILLYKAEDGRKLVVPESHKRDVMAAYHGSMFGAHTGVTKTFRRIRQRYYWPTMRRDIRKFVGGCAQCIPAKAMRKTAVGMRQRVSQVGFPFQAVSIDIVGPFPPSRDGNTCILTLIDQFSRWVEAWPLQDMKAATVVTKLMEEFFPRHGCPEMVLADNAKNFRSKLLKAFLKLMGTSQRFTTPYKPSTNGMLERWHRFLGEQLRAMVGSSDKDWDKKLGPILFAPEQARWSGWVTHRRS